MHIRSIVIWVGGAVTALLLSVMSNAMLCTVMVAWEAITAYNAMRRVANAGGNKNVGKKNFSKRIGKVINTLIKIYSFLLLAAFVDAVLPSPFSTSVLNIATGAVVVWQALSILENESTCSNAKWAAMARRFIIDRVRRFLTK